MKEIFLSQLKAGQQGEIIQIVGGHGVMLRLQALGIRPGKKIEKVSAHFWRGPVTIRVDSSRIALGYGMANKVLVRVEE